MDTIEQKFGIDVAQALKALAEYETGLSSLSKGIGNLGTLMNKFNGSKRVDTFGQAFKQNMPEAVRHTESMILSWETLSRVVQTQFIVRAMSQMRDAIKWTTKSAIEFQQEIARTVTIADGAQFEQISKSVRGISDSFNIGLLETAQGVYQALSNQVGDFGESLRFTEEAARFAKATNSSLANSVDLLSAALASYQLTAADTDKVSGIFFAAIDKGRISAAELGNAFGRIGPIAAELGVSLEETAAGMASVSVKGSKTSETITQLRAIFSALQKPSEAMEEALRKMGFTSSEVAIKTLGLAGVLGELAKSTGGSNEEMARLFPNIRGLAGAASLTSDNLQSISANIQEMTNAGRDFNKEKFLIATATDAERVTGALNKVKNEMVVGLGQASLNAADNLLKLTGGADNLITIAKAGIPAIAGLAGAMGAFKLQTIAANSELKVLSKALGAIGLFTAAAGLGASIGNAVNDKLNENLFRDLNQLKESEKALLDSFTANQKKERDLFNATNSARVQSALQANVDLNKTYIQDIENAKTAQQKKAALDKFTSKTAVDEQSLSKVLNRRFETPDQIAQGLIDAQKKAAELKGQIDAAVAGNKGIDSLRTGLTQVFNDLNKQEATRRVANPELLKQYQDVAAMLSRLKTDGDITAEELNKVIEARNKLGTDASRGGILGSGILNINQLGMASSLNAIDEALRTLQEIQRIQSTIPANTGQLESQLQGIVDVLKTAASDVAFQNAATAISQSVKPAQTIASAMQAAADAADRLSTLRLPETVNRANGGAMNYFANGGRGLETIPAMLSPGEFVVNSKSSGKWFSQLQAMNAGRAPVFREDGGSVTNTTNVGDIIVNGSGRPEATARQVVQAIRREERRGTVKR